MTKEGFKFFKDITYNDYLATVNPEDGNLIFEKPTNIIKEKYSGKMIQGKARSLDFCVTPNHKMVVRKWEEDKINPYRFEEIQNLGWYEQLRIRCYQHKENIVEDIVLPQIVFANSRILPEKKIKMYDWIQFLGIYLAEGCTYTNKNCDGTLTNHRILIAAHKDRERKFVNNLLDRMGINYSNKHSYRIEICSKQIFLELKKLGLIGKHAFDKFVPNFIFCLDYKYIRGFLYAFAMGDGTFRKHGGITFFTSSLKLKEDIIRLLILSGNWLSNSATKKKEKICILGNWVKQNYDIQKIYSHKEDHNIFIIKRKHLKEIDYNGYIYCAEVPSYHTLITRRNGKYLLSGNCVSHALSTTMSYCELKTGLKTV